MFYRDTAAAIHRAQYIRCLYILAPVVLCTILAAMQLYMIRRPDTFGVNAGYYFSGDGAWAGQMQPAAADKDGSTGLVPAPLTGQNDSYLRGDGKWIRASNAPTAAQYLFAKNGSVQNNNGSVYPTPVYLKFAIANTLTVGNAVAQNDETTFTIMPGYSYKITAAIPLTTTPNNDFDWLAIYVNGNSQGISGGGVPASNGNAIGDFLTLCYVTPAVASTVQVGYVGTSGATIYYVWCTIEVVSNNNTILPFVGASADKNGFIGYIPAPLSGQQNYVLTGGGSWAHVITSMTRVGLAGKQTALFTNIPSSAKRITVILDTVTINSGQIPILQLGAGAVQTTNYMASVTYLGSGASGGNYYTDGFRVTSTSASGDVRNGCYVLVTTPGTNVWICTGTFGSQNTFMTQCAGRVELSGTLDRLKLSTSNGTDIFSAGTVNVLYE